MFNTIDDALNYLYSKRNSNKDLSRIKLCIKKLDLKPNYKIILIAGTNGKGSTASYLKNIMKNTIHVGAFTSPFVIRYNERIMINDREISDAEIMYYTAKLKELNDWYEKEYNEVIPFFELTLLMALMFYKDREIDLGIFECGIGGLRDSCNALSPDISIITSISYDHMDVLGNTLEEIARNKLGIVRENKTLIYYNSNPDLDLVFNEFILKYKLNAINVNQYTKITNTIGNIEFYYKDNHYKIAMNGVYQAYNASLAIEAVNRLFSSYPKVFIDEGLINTYLPGRIEVVSEQPKIIIDGAHNVGAINMLYDYFVINKGNKRVVTVFNSLSNKDYKSMLSILDKFSDLYLFMDFNDERKSNINLFIDATNKEYKIINNLDEAYEYSNNDTILLFTGSLHFASFVKNYKKNNI